MQIASPGIDPVLRWPQVKPLVNVSRPTWWRLARDGKAPKPVQISPGCVGWRESEIKAFLASRTPRAEAA